MVTRKLRILPFKTFFILMIPPPPRSTLFPYTTLFRSRRDRRQAPRLGGGAGPARGARVRAVDASGRTVAHPRSLSPPHAPLARPRGRRARDPDRGQIHRAPAARTRAARRRAAGAAPHARQRCDL